MYGPLRALGGRSEGKARRRIALGRRTDTNKPTLEQTNRFAPAPMTCPRCCASRRWHWSASVHQVRHADARTHAHRHANTHTCRRTHARTQTHTREHTHRHTRTRTHSHSHSHLHTHPPHAHRHSRAYTHHANTQMQALHSDTVQDRTQPDPCTHARTHARTLAHTLPVGPCALDAICACLSGAEDCLCM